MTLELSVQLNHVLVTGARGKAALSEGGRVSVGCWWVYVGRRGLRAQWSFPPQAAMTTSSLQINGITWIQERRQLAWGGPATRPAPCSSPHGDLTLLGLWKEHVAPGQRLQLGEGYEASGSKRLLAWNLSHEEHGCPLCLKGSGPI